MAKKPKTDEEVAAFRKRACEVATQLFTEHGPANVTMRQIASGLGVSTMTPYRYFADKDEILATVRAASYNKFAATLERAVKRARDPRAMALSVGDAYVRFANRHPDAYQLMFSISQPHEEQYPELVQANARAQDTMADYVRHMIDAGLLEGDAELIGYMFWASLHGIISLEMAGGLRDINSRTLRDKVMRTLLAGIKAAPPTLND